MIQLDLSNIDTSEKIPLPGNHIVEITRVTIKAKENDEAKEMALINFSFPEVTEAATGGTLPPTFEHLEVICFWAYSNEDEDDMKARLAKVLAQLLGPKGDLSSVTDSTLEELVGNRYKVKAKHEVDKSTGEKRFRIVSYTLIS